MQRTVGYLTLEKCARRKTSRSGAIETILLLVGLLAVVGIVYGL